MHHDSDTVSLYKFLPAADVIDPGARQSAVTRPDARRTRYEPRARRLGRADRPRRTLTDAKPLVLAGAHSRAGLWVLAGDMVLIEPLALLAWSGFDDGLASMMIMPLSVIIGSLVRIACIQHHRYTINLMSILLKFKKKNNKFTLI